MIADRRPDHAVPSRNGGAPQLRVLICEDDEALCMVLQHMLSGDEMVVAGTARDGFEAVRLAHELQPDVVVLDLGMPRLNGRDALPLIRQAAPTARVIVFTAESSTSLERELLAEGAHLYLSKSSPGELRQLISEVARSPVQPPGVVRAVMR